VAKLALQADLCYNKALIWFCRSVAINNLRRDERKACFFRMDTIPHDDTNRKRCTKCEQFFPATLQYFSPQKAMKNGLSSACRQCKHKADKAYRQANAEKVCAYQKEYRQAHLEEHHAYLKAYVKDHKEERRIYLQENAESIQKSTRAYRAVNAEHLSQRRRNYRLTHVEKERAISRNRHARKKANGGIHTEEDIQKQYANQKGRCYYCHAKVGDIYEVDHVIPLSRGGSNDISNLVIACILCNRRKYNKLPHEWHEGGRLL
jgi:5-methylcytosine-specific restriction endonuclease McrA